MNESTKRVAAFGAGTVGGLAVMGLMYLLGRATPASESEPFNAPNIEEDVPLTDPALTGEPVDGAE